MDRHPGKPRQGSGQRAENTCAHCLYFKPPLNNRRPLSGNCALHKQWIEHASLTTCSEMSNKPLIPAGIYRLVAGGNAKWNYIRRKVPIRTRLFLVRRPTAGRG